VEVSDLIEVLGAAADAVAAALGSLDDWGPAGTRPGQYRSDIAADEAAIGILSGAGFGVLSEESGLHDADRPLLAVLDPLDGSTNAARGLPWFATSICVLDSEGPLAALVVNQANGVRYDAIRGGGARRDGRPISASKCETVRRAFVCLSGYPARHLGWRQYRALGAAALDLCAVAEGVLDAYVDCVDRSHGPWDYLGGYLVCLEAGAHVVDALGEELVVRAHADRRTPVGASTAPLLEELLAARAEAARVAPAPPRPGR
jgi:myo-inositol-1(or 4)-monophosphatase